MKKLIILAIFASASAGCSAEDECHKCEATFFNESDGVYITIKSDCNHTSPGNGYVFVSCDK